MIQPCEFHVYHDANEPCPIRNLPQENSPLSLFICSTKQQIPHLPSMDSLLELVFYYAGFNGNIIHSWSTRARRMLRCFSLDNVGFVSQSNGIVTLLQLSIIYGSDFLLFYFKIYWPNNDHFFFQLVSDYIYFCFS